MLSDAQKVDVRRYLNFPLFGGVPVQAFGQRFFQWYGTLEFRMGNMSAAEEGVVTGIFLANLNQLESDLFSVRANVDTEQAAVWKRNAQEFAERRAIFEYWQARLGEFFGMPPRAGAGSIELVV